MSLVLGVDSSTQSTKVEIRDLDSGRVVARGQSPHAPTMRHDRPGCSEADPEDWWRALTRAVAQAVESAKTTGALGVGDRIAAISITGQQHGMVPLDSDGEVVRPAKLWNDTETAPDAVWLSKQLPDGADGWVRACGSVPVAAFTITKLSWLHRSEPDAWARLAHVVLPHDWLTYRLVGELVTDRGDASGTGYWNASSVATTGLDGYRFDLLGIVDGDRDWSTAVPRVLGPYDRAGTVSRDTASALHPALEGAVVAPGTGDNMAVALGVGLRHGDAVVSVGTSVTAFTVSDHPVVDHTGAVAGFADATGRHLPLVCLLNGTQVLSAAQRLLGLDAGAAGHSQFDALALAAPMGSGGVTMLPFLDGERTPDLPRATGTLSGLRSDVSREQLARAAVEGVVCSALGALDALHARSPIDGRVILLGGGSRSRALAQVFADLCDLPVGVVVESDGPVESAAAGAAVQAAAVLSDDDMHAVAARWSLGSTATVTAHAASRDARESVRHAHAALLAQMYG